MYQKEILMGLLVVCVAALVIPSYLYWRKIEILMGRKDGKIR